MRRIGIVVGAIVALVTTGCASKTKEQLGVALAENADLRQRNSELDSQYQQAQMEHDRASAELARKQQELSAAQATAMQNAQYAGQVTTLQAQLASAEQRQKELYEKMNDLLKPRPSDQPTLIASRSPQLAAFQADLRSRLQRYGVTGVDVDIRTAQDGQQRVAVVLQNSFRPGSASLSYNPAAVKAVVGVGKLISESYAGSRVTVEGHTDADPIKKSKWDSNEALSLARAEEVKKLLRQAGVADSRVSAVGMGARQPVARGATERAKAQNRRVEIFIYPAN
jgi:flagellar motor protein MotB